jgi:ribosome maturation factor RimP
MTEQRIISLSTQASEYWDKIQSAIDLKKFELVDLKLGHNNQAGHCTAFIDEIEGTIDLAEVGCITQNIRKVIPDTWTLEVSSPGLDRPLTKVSHFQSSVGKEVKISTSKKAKTGTLSHLSPIGPSLSDTAGNQYQYHWDDIVKANIVFQHQMPGRQKPKRKKKR